MKRRTLQILLLAVLSSSTAMSQINCLSGSAANKLVCEFPFATGTLSDNASFAGPNAAASSAVQAATAMNIAVATQLSQLPLASASAGTVVLFKAGVPVTYDNLGPIMTDRAQTVGKHKLFLGFNTSQFVFTNIDTQRLSALPFTVYVNAYNSSNQLVSTTYTTSTPKVQFRMNQFVGVATLGLTDRFDLSVIVPIERISAASYTPASASYVFDVNGNLLSSTQNASIYAPGTASGIGDASFNGKYELWKGDHGTVSAAASLRAPTGDDLNLLGSGAWGFNPYLIYSYLAKVSPHAKIGYQWNTKTELNNPTQTAGGNQALPGGFQYDAGADWAVHRHVTLAGDILGNQYLNTPYDVLQAASTSVKINGATPVTETPSKSSYSINDFSCGLKWNPAMGLVVSGNVLFQINNNGLKARPTPSLGISYKF